MGAYISFGFILHMFSEFVIAVCLNNKKGVFFSLSFLSPKRTSTSILEKDVDNLS